MKQINFLIILFVVTLFSCDNDDNNNIYGYPVDFRVNIQSFDNDLAGALSTKTFTAPRTNGPYIGYGGLLVIRSAYPRVGTNVLDLYAFDLACPFEKRRDIRVVANADGKAKCEHCGSLFNLLDAKNNIVSGPAKDPLISYPVYYKPNEQGQVFHILSKY